MFIKQFEELTDVLIRKGQCSESDKDIVAYGLSMGIELVFNIITTMLLGIYFDAVFESVVFLLVFPYLRTYTGGYHCKNAKTCYLASTGIILLVLGLIKFTPINIMADISLFLLIVTIPIILKYAPVETATRKLDECEINHFRKKIFKNLTIECILISFLAVFELYSYVFLISVSFFIITLTLVIQMFINKKCNNF